MRFCRFALVVLVASIASAQVEVKSLLGRDLVALPDNDGTVQAAKRQLDSDPKNVALIVALSKAYAAKRQYRNAIQICSKGLVVAPDSSDLYLEKGHRELGLRKFGAARSDLSKAIELNPKALEAYYHLGLSYYFERRFDKAGEAFGKAIDLAKTQDNLIDCANWTYVSLRRAGQDEAAAKVLARITPDVKNTEPHLFFYLQLLHFYQGKLKEEEVLPKKPSSADDIEGELSFDTIGYGIGNWYLYNHKAAKAREYFKNVVSGAAWNSWGFIGSEIELSRNE